MPPQTAKADSIAAAVTASVAAALGGGWTGAVLLEAILQLWPELATTADAAKVTQALATLGFAASEEVALDAALKPAVTEAFSAGWELAQGVSHNPEDALRQGGLQRALDQLSIELKGVSQVSVDRIGNTLAQAVSEGQSSRVAGERIAEILHDPKRAQMIARTEIARAMEGAMLAQAKSMTGVDKQWLDVPSACPICQENAAEGPIKLDNPFVGGAQNPPQHPMCLPGWVRVEASSDGIAVEASTERDYVGDLVTIKTALGHELAATSNHPIATPFGWVEIAALREGDYVLSSTRPEWVVKAINPDVDHVPATIEEIAKALSVALAPVPTAAEDFHGDGAGSQVHVVRTHGLLLDHRSATGAQHAREGTLGWRDLQAEPLDGQSAPEFLAVGMPATTYGSVSGGSQTEPLLVGCGAHSDVHGGAAAARHHATVQETRSDGASADSEGFCKRLLAFAPDVAADQIVQVGRRPFAGHVFNLQTPEGWYMAEAIITHNCRCALSLVPQPV